MNHTTKLAAFLSVSLSFSLSTMLGACGTEVRGAGNGDKIELATAADGSEVTRTYQRGAPASAAGTGLAETEDAILRPPNPTCTRTAELVTDTFWTGAYNLTHPDPDWPTPVVCATNYRVARRLVTSQSPSDIAYYCDSAGYNEGGYFGGRQVEEWFWPENNASWMCSVFAELYCWHTECL